MKIKKIENSHMASSFDAQDNEIRVAFLRHCDDVGISTEHPDDWLMSWQTFVEGFNACIGAIEEELRKGKT